MAAEQQWAKRRLNITECKEVYRGNNSKGEFVIYELQACNEQGVLVNQKLSSFSMLPLGLGDYEVAPYIKDGQLKNYTVRKPGGASGSKAAVDALASRVQYLEDHVKWLTEQVNGLTALTQQMGNGQQVPVAASAPADDGDDIPFHHIEVQWDDRYHPHRELHA
jgi:hypothetical protein